MPIGPTQSCRRTFEAATARHDGETAGVSDIAGARTDKVAPRSLLSCVLALPQPVARHQANCRFTPVIAMR